MSPISQVKVTAMKISTYCEIAGIFPHRTSPDAFTSTLGFATQVVSWTVLAFFLLIGFVFWITNLHDRPDFEKSRRREELEVKV